jgi:hypothetical protein
MASSATGIGFGGIVLQRPDGTVALTDFSNLDGNGYIAPGAGSRNRESHGPYGIHNGGIGGYVPVEFLADQTGIYTVQFSSPNPASGSSNVGPPQPLTTADFAQPNNNTVISAFDVSILSAGGAWQSGRLYANYLTLTAGASSAMQYADLNVLTREGYRYLMSLRALQPYGYFIYTDNVGLQLPDGITPAYESIRYSPTPPNNRRIMIPDVDPETAYETKHKIFFNNPDPSMPASAVLNSVTVWLNPVLNTSTYYVGVTYANTGVPNAMSGTLRFTIPNFGVRYKMQIDVNNNLVFGEAIDKTIHGATDAGLNTVNWDGTDGLGNPVAAGCFNVKLDFIAGEMHVPLADVENFRGGIRIRRLNGNGVLPNDTIHWNDLPLSDLTETPSGSYVKQTPVRGVSSSITLPIDTTIRRWESVVGATIRASHTIGYGDTRFMDQWAFDTLSTNVFTPLACFGVLPDRVIQLTAKRMGSDVRLQFNTAHRPEAGETLELEKSTDGRTFSRLAEFTPDPSKPTQSWLDIAPGKGIYYYRIAWRNRAGERKYSSTVHVDFSRGQGFYYGIYPNPANDVLNINLKPQAGAYTYRLLDNSGRAVLKGTASASAKIDVSRIAEGIYWMEISTSKGEQVIDRVKITKK